MNDRYLYRAKRTDNGEWVEGNLVWSDDADDDYKAIIIPTTGSNMFTRGGSNGDLGFEKWYRVDPSTICQCTGLKDKNGKLIWENDICIIRDGTLDEEDGYFRLDWEIDRAMFEFEGPGLCVNFDNVYGYECEVVGNIFDNPELLE